MPSTAAGRISTKKLYEEWCRKQPNTKRILSSKEFVAGFEPPDYLVDGLLQEGFLYSLTGATGAGKTAITLRLAASIANGIKFAGRETKKRRVLYLAAENPTDVRMRWIALAQQMDFVADEIEVFFVEGVFKLSETAGRLKEEADELGGDFGLVVIDTGPVTAARAEARISNSFLVASFVQCFAFRSKNFRSFSSLVRAAYHSHCLACSKHSAIVGDMDCLRP